MTPEKKLELSLNLVNVFTGQQLELTEIFEMLIITTSTFVGSIHGWNDKNDRELESEISKTIAQYVIKYKTAKMAAWEGLPSRP